MASLTAFASDGTNWTVGNQHGVILENRSSQPLACGQVWSMAGAENGTAAVATASGKILVFRLQPSGNIFTGSVDFPSSHVELSADGTLLAAMGNTLDAQYWRDRSVKIFSLPDFRETATWPHSWDDYPTLSFGFAFSRSGDHLAHLLGTWNGSSWTYSRMLTDVPGRVTYYSDTSRDSEIYKLSPNGDRFSLNHSYGCVPDCAAQLFDGGTLVGAVAGSVAGWLDNDRVLVQTRQGARIYNSRGTFLFTPLFGAYVSAFQVVSPTRIYYGSAIYYLEDGRSVFSIRSASAAAVAGEFIIYSRSAQVLAQRFTRADDASFRPSRNFAAGSAPFSVAVGDFNGDGLPDIAVSNYVDVGTVSVLLGNPGGDFQAARSFATGRYPVPVAVGDFNGDGLLDLAVANFGSDDVAVLLGNGDGNFQAASHFAVGNAPISVAVGDFNGDGSLDFAVTNFGSDDVSVLLGNGDGTFQPAQTFGSGREPSSVAVGDFNGDGWLDLAVGNFGDRNASILLNNGDGTFQEARNFGAGSWPISVAVSDLDGDGSLDLVVANQNSNNVSVLLGNGDGTFRRERSFPAGHFPSSVVIGDFNADGRQDLVVTSENSNAVSILLGNGDGTFRALQSFAAGSTPMSAAVADFNADGLLDLVVANGDSNNISVLINSRP
jgi:hypothetical protein